MDYPELLKGYKNELVKLQEILLKERENRETDEHHAIELLTKVKEQYDLRFRQMTSDYEDKIDQLKLHIQQHIEAQKKLETELQAEQNANQRLLENEQRLEAELIEARSSQETSIKQIWEPDELKKPEAAKQPDLDKRRQTRGETELLTSNQSEIEELKRSLDEMEIKLTHKDNEISNLKLDLRMAQRDVVRNQDQTKFLRESNRELKEKLTSLENELKQHEFQDNSKATEANSLKGLYEACKEKNDQLSERVKTLVEEKQSLNDEIGKLRETIKSKEDLVNKGRATNLKLKEVCEKLEAENEQLNSWYDEQLNEREKNQRERNEYLKKIGDLSGKLQTLQNKLETVEQQLAKTMQEHNAKEQNLEQDGQKHLESLNKLKAQLDNEIENNANYMADIKRLESDCFAKDAELRRYEDKISELVDSLNAIKEERSQNLTISESLKQQNYSLAKMYDDLSRKYLQAKNRMSELLAENDRKDTNFEYETLKFQQKVAQQAKLIDHLTDRLEKSNAKKVTIRLTY